MALLYWISSIHTYSVQINIFSSPFLPADEYIFKSYPEYKKKKVNTGLFRRYEDILDIFPEADECTEIDYLQEFNGKDEDLPF